MLSPGYVRVKYIAVVMVVQSLPFDVIVRGFQPIRDGAVGEPALFTRTHEGELLDGLRLWIFKSNPLRRERVVVLERTRPNSRRAVESFCATPRIAPLGTLLHVTITDVVKAVGCQLLIAKLKIADDDIARFSWSVLFPKGSSYDQAILQKSTQPPIRNTVNSSLTRENRNVLKPMDKIPAVTDVPVSAKSQQLIRRWR